MVSINFFSESLKAPFWRFKLFFCQYSLLPRLSWIARVLCKVLLLQPSQYGLLQLCFFHLPQFLLCKYLNLIIL